MNGLLEAHKNSQLARQYSSESQKYFLAAGVYLETLQPGVNVSHSHVREAYTYMRLALKYMQSSINHIHHLGILHTTQDPAPGPAEEPYSSLQFPQIHLVLCQ